MRVHTSIIESLSRPWNKDHQQVVKLASPECLDISWSDPTNNIIKIMLKTVKKISNNIIMKSYIMHGELVHTSKRRSRQMYLLEINHMYCVHAGENQRKILLCISYYLTWYMIYNPLLTTSHFSYNFLLLTTHSPLTSLLYL